MHFSSIINRKIQNKPNISITPCPIAKACPRGFIREEKRGTRGRRLHFGAKRDKFSFKKSSRPELTIIGIIHTRGPLMFPTVYCLTHFKNTFSIVYKHVSKSYSRKKTRTSRQTIVFWRKTEQG